MHAVRRTDRLSPPNRGNGNVSVEIIPYIACSNVGIHKASNHVQRVEEEALWVQSSKLHGESLSPIEESILNTDLIDGYSTPLYNVSAKESHKKN